MRALFVTTGLFAAALLMTGCADLERASRPADAYAMPDKPLSLPKCAAPQAGVKAQGPNSPTPMQQEAATNCR